MEVTANSLGSVHVLRHSFWPSEHLAIALERYMQPGMTRPRSILYASRTVTIDTLHYPIEEINADYELANRAFLRHHRKKIAVGGSGKEGRRIALRKQSDGGLRVGLLPRTLEDDKLFHTMLSGLDVFPATEHTDMPNTPVRYFLYATIQPSDVDFSATARATQLLDEELTRAESARYYTVTPSAVDHKSMLIPASLPGAERPD